MHSVVLRRQNEFADIGAVDVLIAHCSTGPGVVLAVDEDDGLGGVLRGAHGEVVKAAVEGTRCEVRGVEIAQIAYVFLVLIVPVGELRLIAKSQ